MAYTAPELIKVSISSKEVFSTYCAPDVTDVDADSNGTCETNPVVDKGWSYYECFTFENW